MIIIYENINKYSIKFEKLTESNCIDMVIKARTVIQKFLQENSITIGDNQIFFHFTDLDYPQDRSSLYAKLYIETFITKYAKPKTDAFLWLKMACYKKVNNQFEIRTMEELKDLTENIIGEPSFPKSYSAWIFRDGSALEIQTAHHAYFLSEYLGMKEKDQERWWTKVSMNTVYTHNRMNDAQWNTVKDLTEKYNLSESRVLYESSPDIYI
jgi:hypothetical protein